MVTLIFSGSNRKLLLMMFDDRKRPFFQLCEKIFLERISKNEYVKHLQKLAQKHWKNFLSENAVGLIFELSQNHPYYLNLLCSKLWNISKLPDSRTVKLCWQHCSSRRDTSFITGIDFTQHDSKGFFAINTGRKD